MRQLSILFVSLISSPFVVNGQINNLNHVIRLSYQQAQFDSCASALKRAISQSSGPSQIDYLNLLARTNLRNFKYSKALEAYNLSISIIHQHNLHYSEAHISSLLGKCDIFLMDNKIDSITTIIERLKNKITPASTQYGHYIFHQGSIYSIDNIKLTIEYYKKSLNYYSLEDDRCITSRIWLADILIEERKFQQGFKVITEAINICKTYFPNDNLLLGKCYNVLAYYYHAIDALKIALRTYNDSALHILKPNNSGDVYLKSEIYRLMSWTLQKSGEYYKSLKFSEENLKTKKRFLENNHRKIGEAYYWLATHYFRLSLYDKSELYAKYAIATLNKDSQISYLSQCNSLMGLIHFQNENYERALESFNRASTINDSSYSSEVARIYIELNRTWTYLRSGQIEKADSSCRTNLPVYTSKQNTKPIDLAKWYEIQGQVYEVLHHVDSAKNCYSNGIKVLTDNHINSHVYLTRLLNDYTGLLQKTNDLDEAKNMLNLSMGYEINTIKLNDPRIETLEYSNLHQMITLYLLGQQFYREYQHNQDVSLLDKSRWILSKTKALYHQNRAELLPQINTKIINNSFYNNLFTLHVEVLSEYMANPNLEANLEKVFQTIEETKGSVLHDAQSALIAIQSNLVPDSIRLKESTLKKELNYVKSKLKKESSNELNVRLFNLQSDHDSLIAHLEANYPEYYRLKYDFSTISIKEVQNKLKSHEAVIEYFNGMDRTYNFTITKDTVVFSTIESVNESQIKEYRKLLDQPTGSYIDYTHAAHKLYQQIVRKPLLAIDTNQITSLRIIPDGLLNLIPFESLITVQIDSRKSGNYKRLPYLFKKYNISYGYSSTSMFKFQEPHKALQQPAVLAMAPSTSAGEDLNQLDPLKFNIKEVTNLKDYFDNYAATGLDATEGSFKSNVNSYPIVHLAMHALVNNEDPMDSKMLFAPPQDTLEDGMLHTFELYNMRLNTNMVVLSACNTGSGKLQKGEGVMSLAKAFTYAGSPSVVMSHWLVDDKSTAELMQYFYRHLADGQPKDEALHNAKLDFLDNASPIYHHPYYWNNFVVVGDVSPVVEKYQGYNRRILMFCLIATFASVLGLSERVRVF